MITRRTTLATMAAATWLLAQPAAAQTVWDMSTVWPDKNFHVVNAIRFA